jgi:hypothetical protein
MESKIKESDCFTLTQETDTCYACFYYVPESMRGMDIHTDEFKSQIMDIAPQIKAKLTERSKIMIGYCKT